MQRKRYYMSRLEYVMYSMLVAVFVSAMYGMSVLLEYLFK
jgi:hypothetical protein